jgi:hypothetical protein
LPIREISVRDAVDPRIGYSVSFGEWEAAHAAGLDLWKWEQGEYPRWFRTRVIAWHNMHSLIELHKQDALSRSMKAKSKQHG